MVRNRVVSPADKSLAVTAARAEPADLRCQSGLPVVECPNEKEAVYSAAGG